MAIELTCECGKEFRVKDELAGSVVRCPACKKSVSVLDNSDTADKRETSATDTGPMEKRRGFGRNVLIVVSVAVVAFAAGLAVGHFVLPRTGASSNLTEEQKKQDAERATGARISANPNPVPAGPEKFGTTTITWDTGDGSVGQVYVSVNAGQEKIFADNRAKGTQEAGWIGQGEHQFRLYAGKGHQKVLASVKVTRSN